ncbi:entericidin A/B family lipoprotein [Stakelama tenebrarum]|uniref:Entericidin A/B family lipoprotein n=1 Tax=Stakelama tenebrarum TaxID=2711215 RepID=A0A6G6Y4K1_9SPHN|nr:entericidin A/B family lipoprotein [Sphingosinithalassobacter tenebrarum]QIG79830.1 entericidin A/B family lipoprotein [Sphingosinithalassobacter tenebrarum]
MRKIFFAATIAGMFAISACNTVEGVGQDVSSAGDAVSGAADEAK